MHRTAYEMRISDWSSDVCSSDRALAARRSRRGKELALAIDARRKLGPAPERVVEGTLLGVAEQEGDLRQRDVRIAQQVFGGVSPHRVEHALVGLTERVEPALQGARRQLQCACRIGERDAAVGEIGRAAGRDRVCAYG